MCSLITSSYSHQDAARPAEGCSGRVDMETELQYAGGELSPQQSATCGLFTESGKNFFFVLHML